MKKAFLMLMLLVSTIILCGCASNEDKDTIIKKEPRLSPYLAEETFLALEDSKQINHLQIGRVIVKRESDGILFSAMVIPNRTIIKGSRVELLEVIYKHNFFGVENNFVVVK